MIIETIDYPTRKLTFPNLIIGQEYEVYVVYVTICFLRTIVYKQKLELYIIDRGRKILKLFILGISFVYCFENGYYWDAKVF